jgi:glutathione S-transferase
VEAKLYVILGSHACRTGMLLLEHKRIPYRAVVLPSGLHPLGVRLFGFAGNRSPIRKVDGRTPRALARLDRLGTVPALRIDGRRVQTNRAIARALEELQPDPPLFPADPEPRRSVEEAELWGDEVLQMAARRVVFCAASQGRDGLRNRGGDGRLGPILSRNDTARFLGSRMAARPFRADPAAERQLLASIPEMLDRVDGWIAAGVLNAESLNAADYMIAPSLALLTYRPDLRPVVEARPAAALVDRLLPEPAG